MEEGWVYEGLAWIRHGFMRARRRLPPNNEMLGHLRHALAFASLTHMLMVNVNGIAEVKYGGRMYACYGKGRVSEEGD